MRYLQYHLKSEILKPVDINPELLVNGLKYNQYNGVFPRLPDFNSLDINKTGSIDKLNPTVNVGLNNDFAIQYKGYIKIPEKGLYTFYLTSDDGSRLKISGKTIAELNVRSDLDPWMAEGIVALDKGLYPIDIDYFQYRKRSRLDLEYKLNNGDVKKK